MIVTRRRMIEAGGGFFLAALLAKPAFSAGTIIDVEMHGKDDGAHVWFDPVGIHVEAGQTIRWTNRDPGNSHTVTAYHPDLFDRPLRIPADAKPWDSDYLMPGQSFSVTLAIVGVYDYYCVPHEHAGMVGRIVVGSPQPLAPSAADPSLTPLPEVALNGFPDVDDILAKGVVRHA
jgi:plastocyanin